MPATRGAPVGPEDDDNVRRLHAEGKSRNDIARLTGRSGRTVSRIAERLSLSFERGEMVRVATEARKTDAKARRAAIAQALLEDAEKLRLQLWKPALVYNFGGRDNTYEERTLDQPTFSDQRNIMQAIGVALDRAVKLDAYDKAEGLGADIDVWLAAMAGK